MRWHRAIMLSFVNVRRLEKSGNNMTKIVNHIFIAVCLLYNVAAAHAELATGAVTAGGRIIVPASPSTPGFAGAFGQPVVGSAADGGVWSGIITPDSVTAND